MEQIKTFRDFMSNYNKLSEICFDDCVWDFTTRKVLNKESTCALNCAEKYLKMNQRVSARFQVQTLNLWILLTTLTFSGVPADGKRKCHGSSDSFGQAVRSLLAAVD